MSGKQRKGFELSPYSPPSWAKELTLRPEYKLPLAQIPTPIELWQLSELPEKYTLWLKIDDQTGGTTSGNKIRKLEFLLADAIQKRADSTITAGGIQSNHCRTTALASTRLGLKPFLFLRTENPRAVEELIGNLLLDHLASAEIIPISPSQYARRAELSRELADELQKEGRSPYIIPEGGSNGLGAWGYIEAVREIAVQTAQMGIQISDLVFACGSGGTAAGIALGSALSGAPWRVHAINVCDDANYFYRVVNQILKELGSNLPAEDILDIIDGYKGLGYAKSTREELEFIVRTSVETGIILDPVYTGKAAFGLLRELSRNPDRFQGRDILFIHTGGVFGLYDKLEKIKPLCPKQNYLNWASGK